MTSEVFVALPDGEPVSIGPVDYAITISLRGDKWWLYAWAGDLCCLEDCESREKAFDAAYELLAEDFDEWSASNQDGRPSE